MRISRAEDPYENNIPSPAHSYEGSEADSSRRRELDLKEKYLKQLEADLLKKEEEIRAKINAPAMNSAEKAKTPMAQETVRTQGEPGPVKQEPASFGRPELTFYKPNIIQFSGVDPTPKNESTFESWKNEVESLRSRNILPDYIVGQYIRNSLKMPARNTLMTLGPLASSQEMLDKLTSVFGNVASAQSIMQEFYTAVQQPQESTAMWSLRLEEIAQRLSEKSPMTAEQKNEMLRERFWRSLYDTDLQNATQVYYHQITSFEELRSKVRTEELQRFTHKKAVEDLNNLQQGQKSQTQTKKETQHQPLMFNAEKSKQQELLERLENIEKRIRANLNYQNRQRRRNNQNQNQNQNPNQSQDQNQNRNQNQNQNQKFNQQQQHGKQTQSDKTSNQKDNRQTQGQNTNTTKTQPKKGLN